MHVVILKSRDSPAKIFKGQCLITLQYFFSLRSFSGRNGIDLDVASCSSGEELEKRVNVICKDDKLNPLLLCGSTNK